MSDAPSFIKAASLKVLDQPHLPDILSDDSVDESNPGEDVTREDNRKNNIPFL